MGLYLSPINGRIATMTDLGVTSPIESLKEAISRGSAVFVVGAGLSISATNNAKSASWVGFIEESLGYIRRLGLAGEEAIRLNEQHLQLSQSSEDNYGLMQAAGAVRHWMNQAGEQAEANWLRETVGSLRVPDSDRQRLAPQRALGSLGCPILTTNYDTLIEQALERQSATWTDSSALQKVVSANSGYIGHLHGLWNEPRSIILAEADYSRLSRDEPAQAIEKALSTLKSIVYIGFGSGLEDPNFSRLFDWHRDTFKNSSVRHYRLARNADIDDLRSVHVNDSIDVIPYGGEYSEITSFLESLTPPRLNADLRVDVVGLAHAAIAEQIRQETIVGEVVGEIPNRSIDDLVAPPVLLPLPPEEFQQLRASDPEYDLQRSDPSDVANLTNVVIISGEEQAGVTTTLRWLLYESTRIEPGYVPLFVDFKTFQRATARPLEIQLKIQASILGIIGSTRDPLPPYVAAIDNISMHNGKLSTRVLTELAQGTYRKIFLGCKHGEERELIDQLAAMNVDANIRYIGRLETPDVRKIAALVDPSRANIIAKSVLSLIRNQNLPRNPFTVALLISIIIKGDNIAANTSPTSVLDQYVSLLLGRGDLAEDARYDFDSVQREAVLSDLAQLFFTTKKGAIIESEVLKRIEGFFERFGWQATPAEVLASFCQRRVLRNTNGYIRFSQDSYLYIFLAKAALNDESVLDGFLAEPLVYAPVLRHYAALKRTSKRLIFDMASLLNQWSVDTVSGTAFRAIDVSAPPLEIDMQKMAGSMSDHRNQADYEDYSDVLEPYDINHADDPNVPFPLQLPDDTPDIILFSLTLDLISSVLRDSDQVDDLSTKKQLLVSVLQSWGRFLNAMTTDDLFQEPVAHVAEAAATAIGLKGEKRDAFINRITEWFPPVFTMSGISAALASRVLLRPLDDVLNTNKELHNDVLFAVPAAMMLIDLGAAGWTRQVEDLLRSHNRSWVVVEFLRSILTSAYVNGRVSASESGNLLALVADLHSANYQWPTEIERKSYVSRIGQAIRRQKLQIEASSHTEQPDKGEQSE